MIEIKSICIIGLGYVGLPLAHAFCSKYKVVGFDISQRRVSELLSGYDSTQELAEIQLKEMLKNGAVFSCDVSDIKECEVYIVTVPTPVDRHKRPDMSMLISASKIIGSVLKNGDIVVYESTVYPGCTEEICVPILEKHSGLKFNKDFFCGYSPERINPGDKEHTVTKIKKVTSGSTHEIALKIDRLYASVIEAGTFLAKSIKVAEAAKVIENAQRDINIAFINELAMIFNRLGIDTNDVLEAASTKWNFLNFKPGLVGGHCIGVDPYYLAHKAQEVGYNPEIILAGRRINDNMGVYVANQVVKLMIKKGKKIDGASVIVLGVTFKENCPDIRNSKVVDVVFELKEFGCRVDVYDPLANYKDIEMEYGIKALGAMPNLEEYDAIILAVAHNSFKNLDIKLCDNRVVYDIKGILSNADGRL